ncbi:MAG: hypothetical protein AMXMBFR23_03340 [Chloroflexota bacterium]
MGTIQDFLRGFRRGFAAADPLPRVPVACAVVVFLAGIAAAAAGDPAVGVLCGILAATFVEVAVLRREVRRARAAQARQAMDADYWMAESTRLSQIASALRVDIMEGRGPVHMMPRAGDRFGAVLPCCNRPLRGERVHADVRRVTCWGPSPR